MEKQKSAGAVVYLIENPHPKFLLLKNTLKTTYWEFPKGKIEDGESIEEAAKRETEEETALKNLKIIKGFKHTISWFYKFQNNLISKEASYLLVKVPEEDKNKVSIIPKEKDKPQEHQEFAWLNIEEARERMKIKSNREMLDSAYKFIMEFEKQKTLI